MAGIGIKRNPSVIAPPALPIECRWCGRPARRPAIYCGRKCRQSSFRLRRCGPQVATAPNDVSRPLTFAYADPPYPGTAKKYYGGQPNYAGEVDHAALIASLTAAGYAGWALSTSSRSLRDLLPLCPGSARICAWVKPIGVPAATYGPHATWEPVIVVGGRRRRPGVRDWLRAQPARGGGTLPGRKPIAFCGWLFNLLGMAPGDHLVDVFPGTGIVGRSWAELSSRTLTTPAESGPAGSPGTGRRPAQVYERPC